MGGGEINHRNHREQLWASRWITEHRPFSQGELTLGSNAQMLARPPTSTAPAGTLPSRSVVTTRLQPATVRPPDTASGAQTEYPTQNTTPSYGVESVYASWVNPQPPYVSVAPAYRFFRDLAAILPNHTGIGGGFVLRTPFGRVPVSGAWQQYQEGDHFPVYNRVTGGVGFEVVNHLIDGRSTRCTTFVDAGLRVGWDERSGASVLAEHNYILGITGWNGVNLGFEVQVVAPFSPNDPLTLGLGLRLQFGDPPDQPRATHPIVSAMMGGLSLPVILWWSHYSGPLWTLAAGNSGYFLEALLASGMGSLTGQIPAILHGTAALARSPEAVEKLVGLLSLAGGLATFMIGYSDPSATTLGSTTMMIGGASTCHGFFRGDRTAVRRCQLVVGAAGIGTGAVGFFVADSRERAAWAHLIGATQGVFLRATFPID